MLLECIFCQHNILYGSCKLDYAGSKPAPMDQECPLVQGQVEQGGDGAGVGV